MDTALQLASRQGNPAEMATLLLRAGDVLGAIRTDANAVPDELLESMTECVIRDQTGESRRLIARRVDEAREAKELALLSLKSGNWHFRCVDGGSVCNSYGYRAETETLVVVAFKGKALGILSRANANKCTTRGAAEACVPGCGDIWDGRVKSQERKDLAREILKQLWRKEFRSGEPK